MKTKPAIFFAFMFAVLFVPSAFGADGSTIDRPLAEVVLSGGEMHLIPHEGQVRLSLKVLLPGGQFVEKEFSAGESAVFRIPGGALDGILAYELIQLPEVKTGSLRSTEANRSAGLVPSKSSPVQSGRFQVHNGVFVSPVATEDLSSPQDVLHYDDVIITGSLCVGFDCANGESFGYCTLKLKENNLQFCFEDTSIGSFPTNDWKIQINDTTSGGASYFTLWDTDGGKRPFTIEAGAPAHSLYVEDYGRIGLGTSIPYVELHVKDGDSPTLRLDQDGSSGWTAQSWDMCGNETNFFIRDVTNGSKLCLRIQPNTPSNTLCMRSSGFVGIGTWSPEYKLHVETTGENAIFAIERTDGAQFKLSAVTNKVQIGSQSNHDVRFTTNNIARMAITAAGNVGIGTNSPTHLLDVGTSGAYCNGGAWVDGSSRAFKTDIRTLDGDEAARAVMNLEPVRFRYKQDQSEEFLGFIAEDVPELVAMKNRKGMTAMDVTAVLTKTVQRQQRTIEKQQELLESLRRRLEVLEAEKNK